MATGISRLSFDASYGAMISENNPVLLGYEELLDAFPRYDNLVFVIEVLDGDIYSPRHIRSLRTLEAGASQLPFVFQVKSLLNYTFVEAENDELIVNPLIPTDMPLEASALARIRDKAQNDYLLHGGLISEEGSVTLLSADLNTAFDTRNQSHIQSLSAEAGKLRDTVMSENPGIYIMLLGTATHAKVATQISINDAISLFPIIFLLAIFLTFLITRSLSAIGATLIIMSLSVFAGLGTAGWMGYELNVASSMAAILTMILAMADTVHLGTTYRAELAKGKSKLDAIENSVDKNLRAIILTTLTTMVGFFSLNFIGSHAFADLGNIAVIGVGIAGFISLTAYPTIIITLTRNTTNQGVKQIPLAASLTHIAIYRRKLSFGLFSVLLAVTIPFISLNQFNDDYRNLYSEDHEIRQAIDLLTNKLGYSNQIDYMLEAPSGSNINAPAFLKQVEQFVDWYKAQPEVSHVYSYVELIKRINQIMHNNDQAWYSLPQTQSMASQYLLLYELSSGTEEFISHDKTRLQLLVRCNNLDNRKLISLDARAQAWLQHHTPALVAKGNAKGTGMDLLFAHNAKQAVLSMVTGSVFTIVFITAFLIVGLKSVKYGLLSLIPNLVPAAVIYGLWGIFVRDMNASVAITYSISLGLVIDDTVHILAKYMQLRRKGFTPEGSIQNTLESTALALITTTVALGSGLLVLAFASFKPNADIGLIMAPIIFLALAFDLLVLPGLLLAIDSRVTETETGRNHEEHDISIQ